MEGGLSPARFPVIEPMPPRLCQIFLWSLLANVEYGIAAARGMARRILNHPPTECYCSSGMGLRTKLARAEMDARFGTRSVTASASTDRSRSCPGDEDFDLAC